MSHSPNPVTGSKRKRSPEAGDAGSPIIHLQLTNSATPRECDDPAPPFTVPIAMSVAMQNSALLQQLLDDVTEDDMAAGEGIVIPLAGVPDAATLRRVVLFFEKFSENFDEHTKRVCEDPFKAGSISLSESDFTEWELDFFSGINAEDGCCTSLLRFLTAADYLCSEAAIKLVATYIAALISTRKKGLLQRCRSSPFLPQMLFPTKENTADPFASTFITPHLVSYIVESMVCNVEIAEQDIAEPDIYNEHMDIIQAYVDIFPSFAEGAAYAHGLWKRFTLALQFGPEYQPRCVRVIAARLRVVPDTKLIIEVPGRRTSDPSTQQRELHRHCQFLRDSKKVFLRHNPLIDDHSFSNGDTERFCVTVFGMLWEVEEITLAHHCHMLLEISISEIIGTLPALKKLRIDNMVLSDRLGDVANVKELALFGAWWKKSCQEEGSLNAYIVDMPRNLVTLTIGNPIVSMAQPILATVQKALVDCKSLQTVNVCTRDAFLTGAIKSIGDERVQVNAP